MKKKIIPIVVVCLLLGLGGFKYYQYKHPEKFPEVVEQVSPIKAPVNEAGPGLKEVSSISIAVEPPMNGVMKGVIEVGASGFNSFVVNIDNEKRWELVSKEFGESLAYEGFATTDDVKLGLKKYLSAMFSKGVAGRNAHFVISSGALKNPKTELIAKSIEQMGYVVNRVNPEQEGKYVLRALLPKTYRHNSYTVDIGSGNTKISWYEGDKLRSLEGPGAKYYQNKTPDGEVYGNIRNLVNQIPASSRENCFMIGGVPYQLAKQARIGEERYTKLKIPDDYSGGTDVKLKSGINIYRALYEGTQSPNYIFDWDANFTIGFLLTLN